METEIEVRVSRKSQISFSKKYSQYLSISEFIEEMKFFLENNPRYLTENLFSVVFDLDIGLCVTIQFDRNYYKKHKYRKGRFTVIGFTDYEEMEEGL